MFVIRYLDFFSPATKVQPSNARKVTFSNEIVINMFKFYEMFPYEVSNPLQLILVLDKSSKFPVLGIMLEGSV